MRAFVIGTGLVTAVGESPDEILARLDAGHRGLELARVPDEPGVPELLLGRRVAAPGEEPRAHRLAWAAAARAAAGRRVDAILLGSTTGGIDRTEEELARGATDPAAYLQHDAASIAELLARRLGVTGPSVVVSTACSSGAVALAVALGWLRRGLVRTVLAGGVDSLAALTVHGFRLLQLIDPRGARPLAADRAGMNVAEGAGFLLLEAADAPPLGALAELAGAGLACDAYHATRPHPAGRGVARATARALADAGWTPAQVDYVSLHGTGTVDNDGAELAGLRAVLGDELPPATSIKAGTGHTLAAAGAIEAALVVEALRRGTPLPHVGVSTADPALGVRLDAPPRESLARALDCAFGFGGNDAVLALGRVEPARVEPARVEPARVEPAREGAAAQSRLAPAPLRVGVSAVTLATVHGALRETRAAWLAGASLDGLADMTAALAQIPRAEQRRLSRLGQLVVGLSSAMADMSATTPRSAHVATAHGALVDTCAVLAELRGSSYALASPARFVRSVHNAAAGQAALALGAEGASVTTTHPALALAQCLAAFAAVARTDDLPAVLVAADEHDLVMSPRLQPWLTGPSDGAAGFLLTPPDEAKVTIDVMLLGSSPDGPGWSALRARLDAEPEARLVVRPSPRPHHAATPPWLATHTAERSSAPTCDGGSGPHVGAVVAALLVDHLLETPAAAPLVFVEVDRESIALWIARGCA